MDIQVDMFAVELGAAVLLQFATGEQVVRVLLDAGDSKHDVKARLPLPTANYMDAQRRIDLLVGTHYDKDHLDGLVPIINDRNINIGEAWLPPVVNDSERHPSNHTPTKQNMLPIQLYEGNADEILNRYLLYKGDLCGRLKAVESEIYKTYDRWGEEFAKITRNIRAEKASDEPKYTINFFHEQITETNIITGIIRDSHGDEQIGDPWELTKFVDGVRRAWGWHTTEMEWLFGALDKFPGDRETALSTLATIRRSAARDAINAISLNEVVRALKVRSINIRCETIDAGRPRRFYWIPSEKFFSPIRTPEATGPEIRLLGPSRALVKKHWDKLPLGSYMLGSLYKGLPIEPITASNQLSYIMTFNYLDQNILICGDAGCVDFKRPGTRTYYQELINELHELNIVQVAHHAGHNAHFYHCLQHANYPAQGRLSYLLLSHATDDQNRPSDVFNQFIGSLVRPAGSIELLFTSRPLAANVRNLKSLFGAVVGIPSKSGDVQLEYSSGKWAIKKHAVAPP